MTKYDYIFLGAGCAGLSLLARMIASGIAAEKKILLIDKEPKQKNDRTWCFWEKQPGFFEPIVCKQWDSIWFHAENFSQQFTIAPYRYKMIKGIDFYEHCFGIINKQTGIDILYGEISDISYSENNLHFTLDNEPYTFSNKVVFNSIYNKEESIKQKSIYLLQHFKGWMIETTEPFFKMDEATLMDFRVAQTNGTTFAYVLPLTETKALIEYTLFSEKILPANLYNERIVEYLSEYLQIKDYKIIEEEFGVIPMTNATFPWYKNGMFYIGTAGGQTKASSGYTFQFIQKQSASIIEKIKTNTLSAAMRPASFSKRFHFYDTILLQVLAGKYAGGSEVFTNLFKKNKPQSIFSFLDNETSPAEDFNIIRSLPTVPFLKAALKQLLH